MPLDLSAATPTPTLVHFQASRAYFTSSSYLNFHAFQQHLLAQYQGRLPHDVAEALRGLQRMVATVNTAVEVAFATHHILTLRDLELSVLASSHDFNGLGSFSQLCLGPLSLHPVVQRCLPRAHALSSAAAELTARTILSELSNLYCSAEGAAAVGGDTCPSSNEALQRGFSFLARKVGVHSEGRWQQMATELGVYMRAPEFVSSLVQRCTTAWKGAEDRAIAEATKAGHLSGRSHDAQGDMQAVQDAPVSPPVPADTLRLMLQGAEIESAKLLAAVANQQGIDQEATQFRLPSAALVDVCETLIASPRLSAWLLPYVSAARPSVLMFCHLIDEHCQRNDQPAKPFALPLGLDNAERKELHMHTQRSWPTWRSQSQGSKSQRFLLISPPKGAASGRAAPDSCSISNGRRSRAMASKSRQCDSWEEDTAAAPASTTTFALQVIAEDLIAPIVASLVTILSPQDKTSTPLTNSDTTSSCMASSEQASGGQVTAAAAAALSVSSDAICDHLRSIAEELHQSMEHAQLPSVPLKRLHEAERLLLSQRGVTCFADLGLAEVSFPAFLSKHAEELQPLETLLIGGEVGALASGKAAAGVTAQLLLAAPNADDDAIAAAVGFHFERHLLPTSSVGELRQRCRHAIHQDAQQIARVCVLAIAQSNEGVSTAGVRAVNLFSATREQALRALHAAPLLTDLAATTQWSLLFAAELGELQPFIEMAPTLRRVVLEVRHGTLVRLQAADLGDFRAATLTLDALETVATALFLCVHAGGVALAPIVPMREHVQAVLASTVTATAVSFVRRCLELIPSQMLSGLGGAVFLAAGRGEFPRVSELLFAGASLPQRAALVAVGAELGDSVLLQGFADPICTIAHNRCSAASGEQDNLATNQATIRDATSVGGVADVPWGGAAGDECGHGESADGQRTASSKEPSIVVVSGEVGPGSSKIASVISLAGVVSSTYDGVPSSAVVCSQIKARYGIGIEAQLTTEARTAVEELRGVTMRSITKLAAELYGGDAHYLLELLQNADDNHFEAGVDPTLTIDLCAQSVSFHCNEVGFSESNVFALCSIGESTKAAAGAGYIGNKGIGFKSVFKLSPTPEVHSRDYHLRFDATNGGLGYIVPEPLAAPAGWDAVRGGTCVVLPLQEGEEAARIHLQRLRIHLSQIQPTLLLFLRRLTMLEVVDHSRGVHKRIRRIGIVQEGSQMHPGRSGAMGASFGVANGKVTGESALTDGVSKSADTSLAGAPSHLLGSEVLLEETDTSIEDMHGQEEASAECSLSARQPHTRLQRWLLVRRVLRPEVGKVGNRTTEVAMAFALNESDVDSLQPPPPLDVFAFLPLRSYGLRFILHADWEVPSSRESVDASSAWNQWLRGELPQLFLEATRAFVQRAAAQAVTSPDAAARTLSCFFRTVDHVVDGRGGGGGSCTSCKRRERHRRRWLPPSLTLRHCAQVPLPGHLSDFFGGLAPACCHLLRSAECLMTRDCAFVLPCAAVVLDSFDDCYGASDRGVNAYSIPMSSPNTVYMTEELLSLLSLKPVHPRICLSLQLAQQLGVRRVDASLLGELLGAVCSCIDPLSELVSRLGGDVSTRERDGFGWLACVFDRLQQDASLSSELPGLRRLPLVPLSDGRWSSAEQGAIYLLERGLEGLETCVANVDGLRLVHPALVHELTQKRAALGLLTRLRVQPLGRQELVCDHLVPALASPTTPTLQLPGLLAHALRQSTLCSSLQAGGLERLLVDAGARLVGADGDVYTLRPRGPHSPPMALNESGVALHLSSQLRAEIPAAACIPDGLAGLAVISDAYVQQEPDLADHTSWRTLFLGVGVDWFPVVHLTKDDGCGRGGGGTGDAGEWGSTALSALLADLVCDCDVGRLNLLAAALAERWPALLALGAMHSSTPLMRLLTSTIWLPGTDGTLHCPSELWLQSAPVEVLLGDRVPYSSVALPRALAQALGLMTELKPVSVVALLGEWSLKKGGHVASLQRMSALYRWLHPRIVDDAPLRKQLAESASIWLPTSREAPDGTAVVVGHFYHPLQCVWRGFELTRSLGDAAHTPRKTNEVRALHSFYAGVAEETFVALGVPNKLMLSQYAGFLLHEATSGPPTPAIIRRIYSVFGQLGRVGTAVTRNSIETVLGDAAVFPVASGGWQRLGQLFFSLPARGERGGEGGGQHEERSEGASAASERTLMHAIEVQPEVQVEDIQGVQFFLRNVLQLPTLQECSRLIITTVPTQPLRTTSAAQSARLCAAACAIQRLTSSCMAPEARDEIMWRLRSMEVRLTSEIHYCSKVHAPGGEVFELSPSRESRCLLLLPRTGAEASGGADKKRMREEWGELHGRGQGHLPAVQEVHTVPGEGGKKKLRSSVQSTDINSTSALSTQDWPPSGLPAPGPSTPAPPPAGTRDPVILYLTPAVTPRDVVREVCRLLSLEVRAEATLLLFSVLLRAWDWEGEPPQPQRMRQLCYGPMAEFEQLPPLAATEVWWLTPLVMNAPGDAEGMGVGGASDVDLASELSSALQRERAFLAEHESAREEGGEFARPGRAGTSAAGGTPAIPGEEGLDHALQRAVASSRPRARSVLAAGSLAGDTEEYSLQSTPGAATAALLSSTTSSSVRWEVQALTPELLACSTAGFSVEDRKAVGRWGEHFVFEHLCRAMPAAKVRWVNSDAETGLPYDLTVVPSASARVFIEVKTSAALRKPFFEVSLAELQYAQEMGPAYVIYRVTGAGTANVQLSCLSNPISCLSVGALVLKLGETQA